MKFHIEWDKKSEDNISYGTVFINNSIVGYIIQETSEKFINNFTKQINNDTN